MAITELFFSEYIEGSSFNKALEIFNGTGATVDLSGYTLETYFNGNPTAGATATLSGSIASGDVFVAAHGSANASILAAADLTNSAVINFNGDDAVVLRKNGVVVDVIGQIGFDPGTLWGSGDTLTANATLRRLGTVESGDTDSSDAFDPSLQWQGFPQDTFGGLGSHSITPPATPGITITQSGGTTAVVEGGANDSFEIVLQSQPSADVVITFTTDTETSVSVSPVTFTPLDWNVAQTVTVSAVPDAIDELPDVHASLIQASAASADADYDGIATPSVSVSVTDSQTDPTFISTIQGSGDASPLSGQIVTVRAVVVGDFQNGDADATRNLSGIYLQEEDADADANPLTSEGLFVFLGTSGTDVNVGDVVTVTGTVTEFNGMTELTSVVSLTVESSGNALPTAASIDLSTLGAGASIDANGDVVPNLEAFEGMRVTFTDTLTVTEMFNLDRFNEVKLHEGGRPQNFTQTDVPSVAGYSSFLDDVGGLTITYDDGVNTQNQPIGNLDGFSPFTTATAVSMGDTITGLTGVLDYQWAGTTASNTTWRVRATSDGENDFVDSNPADTVPPDVGGDLQIAGLNVLNFFTTLNSGGNTTTLGQTPRGANNSAEYQRQLDKLVTTLTAMDADVVGLVEIENDTASAPLATLVDALNAKAGAGTYAYVNTGAVGTDAITGAFIYKTAEVALNGSFAVLDTPAFTDPLGTGTYNRPALAQSFTEIATGESFTAVVNHLKSKGGTGTGADADQLDGQGQFNATRTAAAAELAAWLAANPTGDTSGRQIMLGDFNAYAMEDPIQTLAAAGYDDLAQQLIGNSAYSYVFDGLTGTLDYAFTNTGFTSLVYGIAEWHINADEADALDYNTDFGRDVTIFDADSPLRTSDHDPVIVGLNLVSDIDVYDLVGGVLTFSDGWSEFGRALASAKAGSLVDVTDDAAVGDFGLQTVAVDDVTVDGGSPVTGTITLGAGVVSFGFTGSSTIAVTGNALGNIITGSAGENSLSGGTGDDRLEGGAGADVLDGGDDHDIISYLGSAAGVLVDLLNGTAFGGDAAGDSFSNVEGVGGSNQDDSLRGNAAGNTVNGAGGSDMLIGRSGSDTLDGGEGDDTINGGNDADTLIGGNGIDTLITVTTGGAQKIDLIANTISGGDSNGDTISGFENVITGSGDDQLFGSHVANVLTGGAGNDLLSGRRGSDTLDGGEGNDIILGGNDADVLIGGNGTDTLVMRGSGANQTVDLSTNTISGGDSNGDTISGFENVTTGSGNDSLTGNSLANTLNGGAGADVLNGGDGQDSFVFDTVLGPANVDTVTSFIVADDTVVLENAIFTALTTLGVLAAGAFNTGAAASEADDRIILNTATNALSYDADGDGLGAAIQLATLTSITGTVTAADFLII